MADRSKIEWTDASWNPVRAILLDPTNDGGGRYRTGWHCVHVSEGCRNCYAERFNMRLGTGRPYKASELRNPRKGYHGSGQERPEVFLDEKTLTQPLRWRRWSPILPRGEVYSRELTEAGWRSFSEIHGTDEAEVDAPFLKEGSR